MEIDVPERGGRQGTYLTSPYEVRVQYGRSSATRGAAAAVDWFGPLAPPAPAAAADVAGRQWDYPSGFNLQTTPRGASGLSFATLRQLADGYDLLRLILETRKDQVARMSWSIGRRLSGNDDDTAARIETATGFFRRPDGLHGWADWLRLLLEEMFVIDAAALYMQRDRAGRLLHLMPLDGATIKPVIDAWGRSPQPYDESGRLVFPTAYQQVLKGVPAVDYSARDLLYRPRNVRVHRVYGFGPVEQIVTTVNIALRRQAFLLDYFTEGNIPDSLIGVPEAWTPDQIATYQRYWDAYFDGDLARRRRAKFVPGGVARTFVQTKEPELKSAFDEWLARIVCFAFSVSPQAFVQQQNRATAETQKELSEQEGLVPILSWIKSIVDDLLASEFGSPDLEFVWRQDHELDPVTQEAILSSYASKGILTINEARAALGRAPLPVEAADKPMALTAGGYVPIDGGATPHA